MCCFRSIFNGEPHSWRATRVVNGTVELCAVFVVYMATYEVGTLCILRWVGTLQTDVNEVSRCKARDRRTKSTH